MSDLRSASGERVASAMLSLYDGLGQPFTGPVLLYIHNNADLKPRALTGKGPYIQIKVPFHDGIGDDYAVSVASDGYRQSGCFFKANPGILAQPQIILLSESPQPKFATWDSFAADHPQAAQFLMIGTDTAGAESRYRQAAETRPEALACLLNLTQAMAEIQLSNGRTPLDYFHAICWDGSMAQDRFFGYAASELVAAVRESAEHGLFSEEADCATFHPGATHSWKQIAFPVANVQLTFHENDARQIDGVPCVKVEPDIDLYKDLVEHGFGEVFPNLITGRLTDPAAVFVLRWTLARDEGGPQFDPGYELS